MKKDTFGAYLREARKKKAFTQDELANIIGVTTKTLQRWEYGGIILIK